MEDKSLKLIAALDEIDRIRREIGEDGFAILSVRIGRMVKEFRELARTCAHAYGESTRHRGFRK